MARTNSLNMSYRPRVFGFCPCCLCLAILLSQPAGILHCLELRCKWQSWKIHYWLGSVVLSSPVSLTPWTHRAAKFPTVGTTVPTTGSSPGSGSATFMCPAMWWRNMAARLSWLATLGRWMASQIWDTNNHRVLLALTSYHMNQQCILIPYTKVSPFHLGMFSAKSFPILLPSPFVKHPCITSALYKEMKVSAGQLSSLGAGPAAWLGLRSHVGSERERERERETMSFASWTWSIWRKKETTCRKDEIPLYPSLSLFLPDKHLEEENVDFLTCVVADGVQPLKVLVAMVTPAIYTCAGGVAVDQGKVLTGWVETSTVRQ